MQTAKIGDLILASALIRSLKESFPKARVTLLHHPITRPLLKLLPWVDHAELLEPEVLRGWRAKWRLSKRLDELEVDAALLLSPSLPIAFALFWSNIPERLALLTRHAGRTHRLLATLHTGIVWHNPSTHVVDSQLGLLGLLGGDKSYPGRLVLPSGPQSAMPSPLPVGMDYIGVGVGASNKLKELGVEKLIAVCRGLLEETSATVVLIGGPDDQLLAQQVEQRVGSANRLINTTGKWSLDELPRLLGGLRVYVAVDSGVTHMADALEIPQVLIAGPVNVKEVAPLTEYSRVLSVSLPCAPCASVFNTPTMCWVGTRACVHEVTADQIVRAAVEVIGAVKSKDPERRQSGQTTL